MSPILDRDGRIFGRVNLVDALCLAFLVGLVPVAYSSILLFRPARPHIRSVEHAEVNKEERRIANGLDIRLKVKVRGDHLTPNLRAFVDDQPTIGFTFESPNSADVIIGDNVPMGTHDLILYDGVQEVARARGAVVILPTPGAVVRVVGRLIQLDEPTAKALRQGQRFTVDGRPAAEFLRLGPMEPDRHRINVAGGQIEASVDGSWQRDVVMTIHCEPDPDSAKCNLGTTLLGDTKQAVVNVPGAEKPLRVAVSDIVPDADPTPAMLRIRVSDASDLAARIKPGDRDLLSLPIDERAATVSGVRTSAGTFDLELHAGVDRATDGWHYKGQLLTPGAPFSFTTDRYALSGTVVEVVVDGR